MYIPYKSDEGWAGYDWSAYTAPAPVVAPAPAPVVAPAPAPVVAPAPALAPEPVVAEPAFDWANYDWSQGWGGLAGYLAGYDWSAYTTPEPVVAPTSAPVPEPVAAPVVADPAPVVPTTPEYDYINDWLTEQGYFGEDLGKGTYNIYDSANALLGTGYKGLEDTIRDYTSAYYEPYISYIDPAQGIWTQPGTSGGNDHSGDWTTPSTSLTVDQFKKAYGHAPTDPYYSSGMTWGEGLGFIAPKTGYSLDAPWFGSGARIEYGGNAGGWGNTLQGSAATRGSDPFMTYTPGTNGGDNGSGTEGYYTPTMFKDRASLDAAMDTWLLSPEYRDFYGNVQDTGALQDWELLGQLLSGKPYVQGATSWRDFGGDQTKQTIAGENTLYGSEPVFQDGKLVGYKFDLSPWETGDYALNPNGYLRVQDTHGATTSDAFLGRNFLGDGTAWNDISVAMGDGQRFVPLENISKIPGWENVESYNYHQVEKESGFGKIAGILGTVLSFVPGMQPIGMALSAMSSLANGNPLGAILSVVGGSGVLGDVGGAISEAMGGGFDAAANGYGMGTLGANAGGWAPSFTDTLTSSLGAWASDPTTYLKGGLTALQDGDLDFADLENFLLGGVTKSLGTGLKDVFGGLTDSVPVNTALEKFMPGAVNTALVSIVKGGDPITALGDYFIKAGFKEGTDALNGAIAYGLRELGSDRIDSSIMAFEDEYGVPEDIAAGAVEGALDSGDVPSDEPSVEPEPDVEVPFDEPEDFVVEDEPSAEPAPDVEDVTYEPAEDLTPEEVDAELQRVLEESLDEYVPPTQEELDAWAKGDTAWLDKAASKLIQRAVERGGQLTMAAAKDLIQSRVSRPATTGNDNANDNAAEGQARAAAARAAARARKANRLRNDSQTLLAQSKNRGVAPRRAPEQEDMELSPALAEALAALEAMGVESDEMYAAA